MIENLNESYFEKLAEALDNIIPVAWDTIIFYVEIEPDVVTHLFYFKESGNSNFTQGGDIYEKYNVSRKEYLLYVSEVSDLILEFNSEYSDQADSKWTSLTFLLESTGEFKTEFGYDNLELKSDTNRHNEWKEKYLS
ncbi:MAG: hypothetical protein BGN88_07680 [Clostridiales bacterium 43-6]|nr:MAG: hypothetical protein BGN88_07680 [Clostridiales bacterium 43-6]